MEPQRSEIIKQAAIAGGNAINASTLDIVQHKGKDPHNFVTKADLASEKAIIDIITTNFPKDHILSEEGSELEKLLKAKHLWIIDPLDGTNNFKHQRRCSAVSIAYVENGATQIGAVYDFYHEELYFAPKGKGAYLNNKPIQVSKESKLSHSVIATDNAADEESFRKNINSIMSLKPIPWITLMGSGVLGLCSVASGKVDLLVNAHMFPWDHAAAFLIIEEAGGIVRDWDGKKAHFATKGSISGNKTLAEAFLTHLKEQALKDEKKYEKIAGKE